MEDYLVSFIDNSKGEVTTVIRGNNSLDLSFKNIIRLEKIPNSINNINLSGNQIKNLSNLNDDLKELSAINNRIFKIENLPPLEKLNLSHNNISEIENLPDSLIDLNLTGNKKISKVKNIPETLVKINLGNCIIDEVELPKSATHVNLSNNKIRNINIHEKVENLNLSNNDLNSMPKLFSFIKDLNLSNNRIIKISGIKSLSKLEALNLSNNKIKKIENLPNNVLFLKLSNNLITTVENIPKNIIDLELNNNNISNADYNYPLTLIKLNLSFNRISNINSIPEHIDELEISNNYIRKIEFIGKINYFNGSGSNLLEFPNFPNSIRYINLSETKIKKLIDFTLFNNLETLKLEYLEIKELFAIPNSLRRLSLKGNKIKVLKNIFRRIVELDVSYNLISEIPLFLLEIQTLNIFTYIGNPIESRNYLVERWLNDFHNRGINANNRVYDNGQNVHTSSIQSSFRNSLGKIIKDRDVMSLDQVLKKIDKCELLSYNTIELLHNYCESGILHSVYLLSYSDLLRHVWTRIERHESKNELIKILDEEIYSGMGLCFTGRITRLLNVLSGFYHDIEIQIGDNEQISNIILSLRKKYDNVDLLKAVKQELEERNFPPTVIKEWISYL